MKRMCVCVALAFLPLLAGCTISDALFAVFGDSYSGGGYTQADKQYHYNQQVEASQNYAATH